jgi:hypothetical protein
VPSHQAEQLATGNSSIKLFKRLTLGKREFSELALRDAIWRIMVGSHQVKEPK